MALRASLVIFTILTIGLKAHASYPDITSDFITPLGATPHGKFFTFTRLRQAIAGRPNGVPINVTRTTQEEFPALTGQSVSLANLQFGPKPAGVNPPHIHPHLTELIIMLQGFLEVGFVDSTNKLHNQVLHTGDAFVLPKGLVHFEANGDTNNPAIARSAFGSANPGTITVPKKLFASQIFNWALAQSFKT